ncbi:hypothetical protein MHU86_17714 [Fragilaria crotonensis]|nr:hypothetical protein MHU86_17714 [Fragilaria crotonensis]
MVQPKIATIACLGFMIVNVILCMREFSILKFRTAVEENRNTTVASAQTSDAFANTTTAFDTAVQTAYEMAFSKKATPPRKEFDLSNWTRGTGGLSDMDRLLWRKFTETHRQSLNMASANRPSLPVTWEFPLFRS